MNKKSGEVGTVSTSTLSAATSTKGQVVATSTPVKATGTLSGAVVNPPTLNGGIVIATSVSADQAAQLRSQETALITQLKAAPTRVDLWLKLGMYRKLAGDYAGAIAAWNYVAQAGPTTINFIAYGNLGDLYMNFDVNYPKAEANYLAAIKIKPIYIDYYRDLFMLYTSFYKTNQGQANAIVAEGLKSNPGNADLLQLQAQLKSTTQ